MKPQQLKAYRRQLNLTQAAMAQRLGVDLRTYQRWEYNETRIPAAIELALKQIETEKSR